MYRVSLNFPPGPSKPHHGPFPPPRTRDAWTKGRHNGQRQPRPTSRRCCPSLWPWLSWWRGENGLRRPAVYPAERRAQKPPRLKKTLCHKMRRKLLWTTVTAPSKCYLGPVLIAGLNHFPLPANGMRNCTGFPGVLHPYLFRLVTDALPWKPALGKKKKKTIPSTVGSERMRLRPGAYNLCQRTEFSADPSVWSPKVKFVNLPVD